MQYQLITGTTANSTGSKSSKADTAPSTAGYEPGYFFFDQVFFFTLLKMTNKTTFEFIKHNLFLIKLQ